MVGQSARRRPREEPVAGVEDTDVVSTAVIAVRAGDAAGPFAAGDNVDEDDELIDEEHSSAREWLAVVVQLVAGAVAGAALWLAFRWLWRGTPMIAAVAGVLVTVVAVLLVRRIWRSDDVRTTVMTVLIGLFVTMSPAVLLLDL